MVLLLGLGEATKTVLVDYTAPLSFTTVPKPFLVTLSDYTKTASSEWSISAWQYQATAGSALIRAQSPSILFNWSQTTVMLIVDAAITATSQEVFPFNTWVFTLIGSTASMTYGVVTVRTGSQYFLSSASVRPIDATTLIFISSACGFITVMAM